MEPRLNVLKLSAWGAWRTC